MEGIEMKDELTLWHCVGFAFTSLFGTVLHFLYEWTNGSLLAAPFSGVNESTWEHMKLLYFPLFVFALIQSRFFGDYENFWCVKLAAILAGLALIPILFYTYNGMFGRSPDWLNIMIFFISAAGAFLIESHLFKADNLRCSRQKLAFGVVCLVGLLFVVFTFATPQIPLFEDPLTGNYGIK